MLAKFESLKSVYSNGYTECTIFPRHIALFILEGEVAIEDKWNKCLGCSCKLDFTLKENFPAKETEHSDLHAGDYHLIGADLRQLHELKDKLAKCDLNFQAPTLFIAECVLVYMGGGQSDALIAELTNWFDNAFFVNYEQVCRIYITFLFDGY